VWKKIKHGVPQGSVPGPLFLYKHQIFPKLFPYADDTSIMVTNTSPKDLKINMNKVFKYINDGSY
jgi:hypothetical protein